ncbi:MAG: hydrogenase subunit MbhD domain-containing protein [Desulfurococcaceae archaeon]
MIYIVIVVLVASILSTISAYLVIAEKEHITSCILLALLGVLYSLIYYALMAPDIVLAYIPISSIIIPSLFITILTKQKEEKSS